MVGSFSIERCLELGGWDVTELAVEALRVVPVHPPQGGEFEVFDRFLSVAMIPPRAATEAAQRALSPMRCGTALPAV